MIRIFLVEDDPNLSSIVANNLDYEGFAVSVAADGDQALTLNRA